MDLPTRGLNARSRAFPLTILKVAVQYEGRWSQEVAGMAAPQTRSTIRHGRLHIQAPNRHPRQTGISSTSLQVVRQSFIPNAATVIRGSKPSVDVTDKAVASAGKAGIEVSPVGAVPEKACRAVEKTRA